MNTAISAAMILGGLAAIVGIVQAKKGVAWGKPVALLGAILALGLSVQRMVQPSAQELRASQNERFAFVAGEQLGAHFASLHSGARATIYTRPELNTLASTAVEDSAVAGLKAALQKGFDAVDRVVLPGRAASSDGDTEDDVMMLESSDWVDWEKAREMMQDAASPPELMVFMVSPPADFLASAGGASEAVAQVGLLNATPQDVFGLLENGAVNAAVLMSPRITSMPELGESLLDSRAVFDRVFVMVTSENLADVRADYAMVLEP